MKNILVVGARFGDAELGAGGSMIKWAKEGKNVYKLIDNETNFEEYNIRVEFDRMRKELAEVFQILGVKEVRDFLSEKCNHLVYSTETTQRIEKAICELEIDTVVIHSSEDANQDHIEASKICVTAARHCGSILFFKSNGYLLETGFLSKYFVGITDFVKLKKKALCAYSSPNNRKGGLFDSSIKKIISMGIPLAQNMLSHFKSCGWLKNDQ